MEAAAAAGPQVAARPGEVKEQAWLEAGPRSAEPGLRTPEALAAASRPSTEQQRQRRGAEPLDVSQGFGPGLAPAEARISEPTPARVQFSEALPELVRPSEPYSEVASGKSRSAPTKLADVTDGFAWEDQQLERLASGDSPELEQERSDLIQQVYTYE
jgi:hypothetical protein